MKHIGKDYNKNIQDARKKNGIPKDEPVFLIRAQDICGAKAVRAYAQIVTEEAKRVAPSNPIKAELVAHARKCLEHAKLMDEFRNNVASSIPDIK